MAPPIVLLDEEQQRSLLHQQQQSSGRPPSLIQRQGSLGAISSNALGANPRHSSFGAASANSYPMTPASEPDEVQPTIVPKTSFPTTELRTNFTSAAMSARHNRELHDHVVATTERATDLHSNATFASSPRTDFTSRKFLTDFERGYGDSTPPLLSDRLSDTIGPDEKVVSAGYVGSGTTKKISVTYILVGVVLGVSLGVLLSSVKVSTLAAKWISLPGDLFLRALNALVVPYVFCSVAVAIGDIVFVGKVSVVGLQTFKVFVIMWIAAAMLGIGMAVLFRPLFRLDRKYISAPTNAIGFTCSNGMLLKTLSDSSIACAGNATTLGGIVDAAAFEIKDVNNVFAKNVQRALALMTLSDQILAILNLIVPKNIFESLGNGDLLSTITFAMVLGAIAGRSYFTKTRRVNYLYLVLLQLRNAFFLAMEWVMLLTPVAVMSIIAGSFASNQDSTHNLEDVYLYVLASMSTAAIQVLLVQPLVIFLLTRCNPYKHMVQFVEAYVFAFAVSSSVAAAPVTLTCVKKARVCSQSLANFVISIGVCSNMSGAGFYYPLGIMFLAESSGNGAEFTPLRLLAVFLLSILACAGTPPIPSAGVVLMTTIYKTVFGVSDLPSTFPLYLAVDFLVDRISTVCNVNDDIMALKVIAENTDETIVGDHLGERE